MLPAKCYCFNIAKINAVIRLELVKNAADIVNKLHGLGSGRRRFHSRITDPHCQVVRSLNRAK